MSSSDEEDSNYFDWNMHVSWKSNKIDPATPGVSGQHTSRIRSCSHFTSHSSSFLTQNSEDVMVLDDDSECSFDGFSDVSDCAFEGFGLPEGVKVPDDDAIETAELISDKVDSNDVDKVSQDDDISSTTNSELEQIDNVGDSKHFNKVFKYLGLNKQQGSLNQPAVESQANNSWNDKLNFESMHSIDEMVLPLKQSKLKEAPALDKSGNVSEEIDSVQSLEKSNTLHSPVGTPMHRMKKQPCKVSAKKSDSKLSSKRGKSVPKFKKGNSGQLPMGTTSVQSFWKHVFSQPLKKTNITKRLSGSSKKLLKPTVLNAEERKSAYNNLVTSKSRKSLTPVVSGSHSCENSEKLKSSGMEKKITQTYGKFSRQKQITFDINDDKQLFDHYKKSERDFDATKHDVNVEIKEENFDIKEEGTDDCDFIGIYCNQVGCTISWLESTTTKKVTVTKGMVYELDEFAKRICWERSDVAKWILRLRGILDVEPTEDDLLEIRQVVKRRKALSVTLAGRKTGSLKLEEYDTGKFILPSTAKTEAKDLNLATTSWNSMVDRGKETVNTNETESSCISIKGEEEIKVEGDLKVPTPIRKSGRERKPSIRLRESERGSFPSQGLLNANPHSFRKRNISESLSAGSNAGAKRFPSDPWLGSSRKVIMTDSLQNVRANCLKNHSSGDDERISYHHHGGRIYPHFNDVNQDLGKYCRTAGLTVDDLNSFGGRDICITQGIVVELFKFYTKQDCALVYLAEALRKFDKRFAINTFRVEKAILSIVSKSQNSSKFMDKEVSIEKYTDTPRKPPTHIKKCITVNDDPRVSFFIHAGHVYPYFKETSHKLGKYCRAIHLTVNDLNSIYDKEIHITHGAVLELHKFYQDRGCSLIFLARRLSKFRGNTIVNTASIKTKISVLTQKKRQDKALMRQMFFLPTPKTIIKGPDGHSFSKNAKKLPEIDHGEKGEKTKTYHKTVMKSQRVKKDFKLVVEGKRIEKVPQVYDYHQKKQNYPFFEVSNHFLGKYCHEAGVNVDDLNNRDVIEVKVTQGMIVELHNFYVSQRCPVKWLIERLWNFRRSPRGTDTSMYMCIRNLVEKANESNALFMSAPFRYPNSKKFVQVEHIVKQHEGQKKDEIKTEDANTVEIDSTTAEKVKDSVSPSTKRKVMIVKDLSDLNDKGKAYFKSKTPDSGVDDKADCKSKTLDSSFDDKADCKRHDSGVDNIADCKSKTPDSGVDDKANCKSMTPDSGVDNKAGCKSKTPDSGFDDKAVCKSKTPDSGVDDNADCRSKTPDSGDNKAGCKSKTPDSGIDEKGDCKSKAPDSGVDNKAGCKSKTPDSGVDNKADCKSKTPDSCVNDNADCKSKTLDSGVDDTESFQGFSNLGDNYHAKKSLSDYIFRKKFINCSFDSQESLVVHGMKEDNSKINTLIKKNYIDAAVVSDVKGKRRLSESDVDIDDSRETCCSEDASDTEESSTNFQILEGMNEDKSRPDIFVSTNIMKVQDVCKEINNHTTTTFKQKNADCNDDANMEIYAKKENSYKRRKVLMKKHKDWGFKSEVEDQCMSSDSDEDTYDVQYMQSSEDGNFTPESIGSQSLHNGNFDSQIRDVENERKTNMDCSAQVKLESSDLNSNTGELLSGNTVEFQERDFEHENIQLNLGGSLLQKNSDVHVENEMDIICDKEEMEKESIGQINKENSNMKENSCKNYENSGKQVSLDRSVEHQNTEIAGRNQIESSEYGSKDRKGRSVFVPAVNIVDKMVKIQAGNDLLTNLVETKEDCSNKIFDKSLQLNSSGSYMSGQTIELIDRNKKENEKLITASKKSERIRLKAKNINWKLKYLLAGEKKVSGGQVSAMNCKDSLQCSKLLNNDSATSIENEKKKDSRVSFSNIEGRTLPHFTEKEYFLGNHCYAAGLRVEDLNSRDAKDVHLTNGVVWELLRFYLDRKCTFSALADRLLHFKRIACTGIAIVNLVAKLKRVGNLENKEKLKQEFEFPPAIFNVLKTKQSYLKNTKAKNSKKILKKSKKRQKQGKYYSKKHLPKSKKNHNCKKQLKKKESDRNTCEINGDKNVGEMPFVEKEIENAKGKEGCVTRADIVLLYVDWLKMKKRKSGSSVFVSDLLKNVVNLMEERKVFKMHIPAGMLMSSSVKLYEEYKRMWQTSKEDALLYLEEDWLEDIQYLVSITQPSRRSTNDGEDGPENTADGCLPERQLVDNETVHLPSHCHEDNSSDDSSMGCLRIDDSTDKDHSDSCALASDTFRCVKKIGNGGAESDRHFEKVDEKHGNLCEVTDYSSLKEEESQMCRKNAKECTYKLASCKEPLAGNEITYDGEAKEKFAPGNKSPDGNSTEKGSDFLNDSGGFMESKHRDGRKNEKEYKQSCLPHRNYSSSTLAGTNQEEQRTLGNAYKKILLSKGVSQPNIHKRDKEISDGVCETAFVKDVKIQSIQKSVFRTAKNPSVFADMLSSRFNYLTSKESCRIESISDYTCLVDENLKRQVSYLVHFSGSDNEKDTWIKEKDLHCSESILNSVSSTFSMVKSIDDKLKWQSVKPNSKVKPSREKEGLEIAINIIDKNKQSADSATEVHDKENVPTASVGISESKIKEEVLTVGTLLQLYDKWRRGNQHFSDSKTCSSVNVKPFTDEFEKLLSSKGIKNEYSQSLLQSCFVLTLRRRMLHSEKAIQMFLDQNCLPVLKASSAQKLHNKGDKVGRVSLCLGNMQEEYAKSRELKAKQALKLQLVEKEVDCLKRLCSKGILKQKLIDKAVSEEISNIKKTLQKNETSKSLSLAKQCSFENPEIYEKTSKDLLKNGVAEKEIDNVMDAILTVVGDTASNFHGGSD